MFRIKKKRGRPKKKTTNTCGRSNGSLKQIIKVDTTTATTPRGRKKEKISNPLRSSLRTRSIIQNEIIPKIGLVPIKKLIMTPNFYEEEVTSPEKLDQLLSSESEEDENSWWSKCKPKDDDEWQTEQEKKLKALKERLLLLEEMKKQKKLQRSSPARVSCTECDKTFIKNDVLKVHMRTHTGSRPYSCKICQKSFTRRTHLKQHALIHSGSTPYICNAIVNGVVCGKAFAQKPGLIGHRKGHSGVLPPLSKVSIDLLLRGVNYE